MESCLTLLVKPFYHKLPGQTTVYHGLQEFTKEGCQGEWPVTCDQIRVPAHLKGGNDQRLIPMVELMKNAKKLSFATWERFSAFQMGYLCIQCLNSGRAPIWSSILQLSADSLSQSQSGFVLFQFSCYETYQSKPRNLTWLKRIVPIPQQ